MNSSVKVFIAIIHCCLCASVCSQNQQLGLLPSINLNKNLENDWRVNLKIESRQLFYDTSRDDDSSDYEYVLTDFALLASKKIGLTNRLAGGYQLRYHDGNTIHRFIQQFTHVRRFSSFRMAHRISTDQTTATNEPVEYRFRYRATVELPLNGSSVDPKEWYVKVNNEYLNSFEDSDYDFEIRLVPLLGYKFTDSNKLESGLDYRIDSFINDSARNRFWISLNWYLII